MYHHIDVSIFFLMYHACVGESDVKLYLLTHSLHVCIIYNRDILIHFEVGIAKISDLAKLNHFNSLEVVDRKI